MKVANWSLVGLLTEKGVSRTSAEHGKTVTGQTDTKAPGNSGGAGEKLGELKDKIKMKLHKS